MKLSYISMAVLLVSVLSVVSTVQAQTPASDSQSAVSSAASPAQSASTTVEVPRFIKFSGTLLDSQERPVAGLVGVTFALYTHQTGGAALWLETQNVKPDESGNYTVLLGAASANGVPVELFTSAEARWLGIQVGQQPEKERILLVSVPYALKAGDAQTLGGKPLSAFQLAVPASDGLASSSAVSNGPQPAVLEQSNEIVCLSGTACKTGFIPQFVSNGGSATVSDSLITQASSTITISGSEKITGSESVTGSLSTSSGSFKGHTSGPDVVVTNSGSGDGIDITAASGSGNGVAVTNTVTNGVGVLSTSYLPFVGHSSGSIAVLGVVNNDANFLSAVYGIEFGATKKTLGVEGYSGSTDGAGVFGFDIDNSIWAGTLAGHAGVWGDTGSPGCTGVRGTADDGIAFVGTNTSVNPTVLFDNTTTDPSGLVFETLASNFPAGCTIDVKANLSCTGTKSAVVPVNGGTRQVALYAIEGPENWFEDAGSSQLSNGEAVVNLESVFGETVNTGINYHVFLTPNGDCRGLYVAQKTPTSFVVRELGGGASNISFDYRIMAKRKGYESIRLADKSVVFNPNNTAVRRSGSQSSKVPDPHELQKLIQSHAPVLSTAQPESPR